MKSDNSFSTILVIVVGFLALHIIFSWSWALMVSFFVGILGILSGYLRQKIEWVWFKIALLLQYIIPNILLTLVYFLVLYPLSVLTKIFKKDILMLSNKYNSYFIDINKNLIRKVSKNRGEL